MAKLLKLRRGTTTQHGSFTGAEGEVTVDTTKDTLVVHDGSTQSGHTLLREDMSNLPAGTIDNADVNASAAIAGTKISPNFGSQNIETTGNIDISDSTAGTNNRIKLGTDDDLQFYHSGSNSFVRHVAAGTGDLYIDSQGSNDIYLRAGDGASGTHINLKCVSDGGVQLYHNDVLKFNTNSNGCRFVGMLAGIDNEKVALGTSNDLQIYHDGSNSYIYQDGTGELKVNTGTFRVMNKNGNETQFYATQNGKVILYYDNSNKLETYASGVEVKGNLWIQDGTSTDNRLTVGTSGDLSIYHDGSHSRIVNSTGDLVLQGADIYLNSTNNQEHKAVFRDDDGVDLYYDGSLKFSTTSTGWKTLDSEKGHFGTGGDLQIYHSGSNSFIKKIAAGAGHLYLDSDGTGDVYLRAGDGGTSRNVSVRCHSNGGVDLRYQGTAKLETDPNGVKFNDDFYVLDSNKGYFGTGNDLSIYHNGSASYIDNGTGILWIRNQSSIYQRSDEILLQTYTDSTNENYLVATRAGNVKLYYDHSHKFSTASHGVYIPNDSDIRLDGGSWTGDYTGGIKIQPTTGDSYFQYHGTLEFRKTNGAHAVQISQSGNITAVGNVTAYSDRRLKTDIHTINDALGICGKLRGVSYKWIETNKPSIGVIAQEVEEVIPEVVLNTVETDPATGEKTEVKSVDYGKIVGVLINAINELRAEVDELKGGK